MNNQQLVGELRKAAIRESDKWGRNPLSDLLNLAADRIMKLIGRKKGDAVDE